MCVCVCAGAGAGARAAVLPSTSDRQFSLTFRHSIKIKFLYGVLPSTSDGQLSLTFRYIIKIKFLERLSCCIIISNCSKVPVKQYTSRQNLSMWDGKEYFTNTPANIFFF